MILNTAYKVKDGVCARGYYGGSWASLAGLKLVCHNSYGDRLEFVYRSPGNIDLSIWTATESECKKYLELWTNPPGKVKPPTIQKRFSEVAEVVLTVTQKGIKVFLKSEAIPHILGIEANSEIIESSNVPLKSIRCFPRILETESLFSDSQKVNCSLFYREGIASGVEVILDSYYDVYTKKDLFKVINSFRAYLESIKENYPGYFGKPITLKKRVRKVG